MDWRGWSLGGGVRAHPAHHEPGPLEAGGRVRGRPLGALRHLGAAQARDGGQDLLVDPVLPAEARMLGEQLGVIDDTGLPRSPIIQGDVVHEIGDVLLGQVRE